MAKIDKQFVAFHEGKEVEPEIQDVPYITRENEPVSSEPNFILKGDPTESTPAYEKDEVLEDYHKRIWKSKKTDDGNTTNFVTMKFMVICLAIAIIVSTALGAGIALAIGTEKDTGSKTHSNLSETDKSQATGSQLTVNEIVEKNADAVVEIVTASTTTGMWGQTQLAEGAGSGVIVNAKGYIVTNYHVIEGANSVTVTLHNGDEYKATIIGGDDDNDLAVLKINASNLTVATMGDSSKVAVGDMAVAIGNPLGQLGGTATAGIISALDRQLTIENRTLTLLQTDAAINPGNSGGGLFNGAGELIGIVDAKTSAAGVEGLAFALPINTLKDEIDDLINNGKVSSKPSIGITIYDISNENAQYYNLDGAGVYIAQVSGDNAQKAGFKEGDKVVSFNDKKIKDSSDLISKVRKCKVGDMVTVGIIRDGQEISIKTKLEESVNTTGQSSNQDEQSNGQGGSNGLNPFDIFGGNEDEGLGW